MGASAPSQGDENSEWEGDHREEADTWRRMSKPIDRIVTAPPGEPPKMFVRFWKTAIECGVKEAPRHTIRRRLDEPTSWNSVRRFRSKMVRLA